MHPHSHHTRLPFTSLTISPIPDPSFDPSRVPLRFVASLLVPFNMLNRRLQQSAPPPPPSSAHTAVHATASKPDPFYGHEYIAHLCARFITHLFACPIAYALHRTKLHPSVTFAALVLLQGLKARFPTARGSSGHRLFISAFMITSKVICNDTYSNKSWSIVAQPPRDQPDGTRDVFLPRMGAHRRQRHPR